MKINLDTIKLVEIIRKKTNVQPSNLLEEFYDIDFMFDDISEEMNIEFKSLQAELEHKIWLDKNNLIHNHYINLNKKLDKRIENLKKY